MRRIYPSPHLPPALVKQFERRFPELMTGPLAPLARNPVLLYLTRLNGEAQRKAFSNLYKVTAILAGEGVNPVHFPWWAVEYVHMALVRNTLRQSCGYSMVNQVLSACRGVLKECWRLKLMDGDAYQRAASIESVRGMPARRGRYVTRKEIRAMFASCRQEDSTRSSRDAAVLGVLYGGGLRRGEVVRLQLEDYEAESGELNISGTKSQKRRNVFLGNEFKAALEGWLRLRDDEPGHLFRRIHRDGNIWRQPMGGEIIRRHLRERAQLAGVPHFTPHDLRRSYVSNLLEAGVDVFTVKDLAGHAWINTTVLYDRRGDVAKRRAGQRLTLEVEEVGS